MSFMDGPYAYQSKIKSKNEKQEGTIFGLTSAFPIAKGHNPNVFNVSLVLNISLLDNFEYIYSIKIFRERAVLFISINIIYSSFKKTTLQFVSGCYTFIRYI